MWDGILPYTSRLDSRCEFMGEPPTFGEICLHGAGDAGVVE